MSEIKKAKEVLSKYLGIFKEPSDSVLDIDEKFFSASALNPFINYNSSPRGLMMSSHLAQMLVLDNPEPRIIKTGLEYELGKHAMNIVADSDWEVIKVIPRYRKHIVGMDKVAEYVIVYYDLEREIHNIVRIPRFKRNHPYFGFVYNIDEEYLEGLTQGDIIPKGTVLAWSNNYDPHTEEYSFGLNANVALMPLDEVSEDGIVITESFAKKMSFKIIEHRSIEGGKDSVFLNLYGDEDNYKPFPDIGEKINKTGIVVGTRKYDDMLSPGLFSKKDLTHYNNIFDKLEYMYNKYGTVVDIKAYFNKNKSKALLSGTEKHIDKYVDGLTYFYKEIIDTYEYLNKGYYKINKKNLIVGHEFNNLIVEAMNLVDMKDPNTKIKKTYKNNPLDLYRVEFDVVESMRLYPGNKLVDLHGAKGVIVRVIPDEEAPVDADGNRADIIMDPTSTVSRINIGRLYERYLMASSRKAKKLIKEEINRSGGIPNLSKENIENIFKDYVLEYLKILDTDQYREYVKVYTDKDHLTMIEILTEIYEKEFYIYFTVDNEKRAYEIVLDLEDSKFRPTYGPVRYKKNGESFITKDPVFIAPMYFILLNKIADSLLIAASAKINHFRIPIGVSKEEKYRLPFRNTPVRALGETESRAYGAYGGRKFLAELADRSASVKSHEEVYKSILEAPAPTNIDKNIDRTKIPYGKHAILELFKTLLNTNGIDIKFTEDKRRHVFDIPKDWDNNDIDIDIGITIKEEGETDE